MAGISVANSGDGQAPAAVDNSPKSAANQGEFQQLLQDSPGAPGSKAQRTGLDNQIAGKVAEAFSSIFSKGPDGVRDKNAAQALQGGNDLMSSKDNSAQDQKSEAKAQEQKAANPEVLARSSAADLIRSGAPLDQVFAAKADEAAAKKDAATNLGAEKKDNAPTTSDGGKPDAPRGAENPTSAKQDAASTARQQPQFGGDKSLASQPDGKQGAAQASEASPATSQQSSPQAATPPSQNGPIHANQPASNEASQPRGNGEETIRRQVTDEAARTRTASNDAPAQETSHIFDGAGDRSMDGFAGTDTLSGRGASGARDAGTDPKPTEALPLAAQGMAHGVPGMSIAGDKTKTQRLIDTGDIFMEFDLPPNDVGAEKLYIEGGTARLLGPDTVIVYNGIDGRGLINGKPLTADHGNGEIDGEDVGAASLSPSHSKVLAVRPEPGTSEAWRITSRFSNAQILHVVAFESR